MTDIVLENESLPQVPPEVDEIIQRVMDGEEEMVSLEEFCHLMEDNDADQKCDSNQSFEEKSTQARS